MPPRAFPFPLKVGIDICHIPRVKSILTKNVGQGKRESKPLSHFLSKVLTWPERQYFWDRFKDNEAAYKDIDKVSQYLSGRWAAKEACRKACTHMGISNGMHQIMILPISTAETAAAGASSSAPKGIILREELHPYLTGREAPKSSGHVRFVGAKRSYFKIDDVDGQFCEVSISHDEKLATAVAMVPHISWLPSIEKGNTFKSVGIGGNKPETEVSNDDNPTELEDLPGGDK